jgi:hypothetical protein
MPGAGDFSIDHFDMTGVIDFDGRGGFSSVGQIMSDLVETGHGAYQLVLPDGSGTITFSHAGVITAANFLVG